MVVLNDKMHSPKIEQNRCDIWKDRNKKILYFFRNVKNDIRLVGKHEYPAIIINERLCLNAYVKRTNIYITDSVSKGTILHVFNIEGDELISDEEFNKILKKGFHRTVYRIRLNKNNMYLHSFKKMTRNTKTQVIPLFSNDEGKIYFNLDHAKKIIDTYKHYDLIID
jgi:hypothetical protein